MIVHVPILISRNNNFYIIGVFTNIDEAYKIGLQCEYEHNCNSIKNKFTLIKYRELCIKTSHMSKIEQSFLQEWFNLREYIEDIKYKFVIDSREVDKKEYYKIKNEETEEITESSEDEEYAIINELEL
jgi:hypothetical protein